jgi:hypothetical protein
MWSVFKMVALSKIKNAGFDVAIDGDGFTVTNASALTPSQRDFLKAHKAEIMTELKNCVEWRELPDIDYGGLVVVCFTPQGNPVEVQARDEEHAAWLLQMNPKPTAPTVELKDMGGAE